MSHGSRPFALARSVAALAIALTGLSFAGAAPRPAEAALARWAGGIDLYRTGVFTTQQTWLWCTAADVQIVRNIVDRTADHTRAGQQRYFDAMRAHDRYAIPLKDGVDPAGWAYGLRHFVDSRYRLVASSSFDAALRSAVTSLRRTNLPVGITVAHGDHAWVLTGFSATADPATTTRFTVTSVRVVGPLWGLQSTSFGYDMRPDTKLTPAQLAGFFSPWHYAGLRMAWEGEWVSVQPTGSSRVPPAPTPKATAKPTPTPAPPTPAPKTPSPSDPPSASLMPEASASADPGASPSPPPLTALAPGAPASSDIPNGGDLVVAPARPPAAEAAAIAPAEWLLAGLAVGGILAVLAVRRFRARAGHR